MSLYDCDYTLQEQNVNNPRFRLPNITNFLNVLMKALQFSHDNIFNDYAQGSTYPAWATATSYTYGTKIQYGFSVYSCILAHTSSSSIKPTNSTYWYKTNANFIGMNERILYTGQKLIMEYALNRQFQITPFSSIQWDNGTATAPPYTQIYITNNTAQIGGFFLSPNDNFTQPICQSDSLTGDIAPTDYVFTSNYWFTIHVPSAVASAINTLYGQSVPFYQSVIRAIADKYTEAGKIYNIVTY